MLAKPSIFGSGLPGCELWWQGYYNMTLCMQVIVIQCHRMLARVAILKILIPFNLQPYTHVVSKEEEGVVVVSGRRGSTDLLTTSTTNSKSSRGTISDVATYVRGRPLPGDTGVSHL